MRDDEGRRRRELGAAAPTEWGQGVDSKGHSPHNPKLSCSAVVPLQHSDKANDTFNNSTAGEGLGKWKPCQGQDEQGKDGMHREGRFELTPDPSHVITPGGLSLCPDLKRCWQSPSQRVNMWQPLNSASHSEEPPGPPLSIDETPLQPPRMEGTHPSLTSCRPLTVLPLDHP